MLRKQWETHVQGRSWSGEISIVRQISRMSTSRIGCTAAQALRATSAGAGGRPAAKRARLVEREAGHVTRNGGKIEASYGTTSVVA